MSFITKRERVFNEYEQYDLPSRNEGKLKAYSSCTDARAWSHFGSDQAEHLVEVIKRNNETCRPKYIPTTVIIDMLMIGKNNEIERLKRKIEEFEDMLKCYDRLDLTCEQKCDIAKAHTRKKLQVKHAAIKEANKELDDLCLNLNISGLTEAMDSEGFQTGKSSGDEACKCTPRTRDEWSKETKSAQAELMCDCDASTMATDPRIDEMKDTIITKDAKLNAMHNTIAVMENDVCEPYCIYAHIYTALEKILAILCQNTKYKSYLDLMTSGRDTRCIDIKGKILFKLKILEKFSLALIAPCSSEMCCDPVPCCEQTFCDTEQCCDTEPQNYCCYRADVMTRVETTFALTSAEIKTPSLDKKRAQLVADIMGNDEMKEIMCKDSCLAKTDLEVDDCTVEYYNIETENLKRLKQLQENYDDLVTCYESLKHEKDCLLIRCRKYEEMEKEFENLKCQLREYNTLWNEKEHYRKRSVDLDALKEQYLILSNETCNLETELKAEAEINNIKNKTIEELRKENLTLERKLNDAFIAFERDQNSLQCKLKECECKEMCQNQQIKTLSVQIDRLLEQDPEKCSTRLDDITLLDEMNSQKEQIQNLKDLLYQCEEEKQQVQDDYQNKLDLINSLKMEIEDWKSTYEKSIQRNDYLEKYTDDISDKIQTLKESNDFLTLELKDKTNALENIVEVLNNKSIEVSTLMETLEQKNEENRELYDQIQKLEVSYQEYISELDNEKVEAKTSLQVARRESQELLDKVKKYADKANKYEELYHTLQAQSEENNKLKLLLENTQEENRKVLLELKTFDNKNLHLQQEIDHLREINISATNNINSLQDENTQYKLSLQLSRKESQILDDKLQRYEDLSLQLHKLRDSHERLLEEKSKLENELHRKTLALVDAAQSIQVTRTQSEELLSRLKNSENAQADLSMLNEAYQRIVSDKEALQQELLHKNNEFDNLLRSFQKLQNENLIKYQEVNELTNELKSLKAMYDELLMEKTALQNNDDDKTKELKNLYSSLDSKIEENRDLYQQIQLLETNHKSVTNVLNQLKAEHSDTETVLSSLRKDSDVLMNRVKDYEKLELEYDKLKRAYENSQSDKNRLKRELEMQISDLRKLQNENNDLNTQSQTLLSHSEDLENALMTARTELIAKTSSSEDRSISILREIEELTKEKLQNHKKIRELVDKLDESESIIFSLSEKVSARDHKIAVLDNHINELKNEINRLHETLALAVDVGEEVTDNTVKKVSDCLLSMEAHHSKATHNMKTELAKLKSENEKLEQQISIDEVKNTEFNHDTHKYIYHINNLENERELIITDIKQLEIKSVGDSALSPDNCNIEHVLNSLDRIRQYLDTKTSKNSVLEQALQKMQNSYQVVQSKADEATKIVEIEKQKIITEKEEAIRDKINMEKELVGLRQQLENQTSHDKAVIKDLEAEILNEKLIIDKINKSTQSYINKLEKKIESLQNMYKNALRKIAELENQVKFINDEHATNVEKANKYLEEKCMEIDHLKKQLSILQKSVTQDASTQTKMKNVNNIESQTDRVMKEEHFMRYEKNDTQKILQDSKQRNQNTLHGDNSKQLNAVQVLTANVDSNFDYDKDNSSTQKEQLVSGKKSEQYSMSAAETSSHGRATINKHKKPSGEQDSKRVKNVTPTTHKKENDKVKDIYKKQSSETNSLIGNYEKNTEDSNRMDQNNNNRNLNQLSDGNGSEIYIENQLVYSTTFASHSSASNDKDLFVIYHDSESTHENPPNTHWKNRQSEILVESVSVEPKLDVLNDEQKNAHQNRSGNVTSYSLIDTDDLDEDDSVKQKLNIDLPRVDLDTHSVDSETDNKSLDSYNLATYSTPEKYSHYKTTDSSAKLRKNQTESVSIENSNYPMDSVTSKSKQMTSQKTNINREADEISSNLTKASKKTLESDFKLSRVGSDVLLLKTNDSYKKSRGPNDTNFALNYILDSVEQERLDNFKIYDTAKALKRARSEERLNKVTKIIDRSDSSPSRLSEAKKSSSINPKSPTTGCSQSKTSENSEIKSYKERSVMAKLDSVESYENKIRSLSNTLESIQKDYKKKVEVIKSQYDNNIKCLINEHNHGVHSIQSLHEETLHDIIKMHENEVENWRTMSIEAMRKADILEKENQSLKSKINLSSIGLDGEPTKIPPPDLKKRRKSHTGAKMLSKTMIEAFNVKPKKTHSPCTCSLDVNLSDTIRNIFEKVDVDQRKLAEFTYLKYIANKILGSNLESLDTQELSFLHFKVCRIWKIKINKEEALQKRIDSLEAELMHKQRNTQQNIADLDRKVAEERRRLQEVREAVCRHSPTVQSETVEDVTPSATLPSGQGVKISCFCNTPNCRLEVCERRSAGDLNQVNNPQTIRPKRARTESNRAVLAKMDDEERKERKMTDETPTRLRKPHDRLSRATKK